MVDAVTYDAERYGNAQGHEGASHKIVHSLGPGAHFTLDSVLQDHAADIGASILQIDGKQYALMFPEGDGRFDVIGDLSEIKEKLRFYHQPLSEIPRRLIKEEIALANDNLDYQEGDHALKRAKNATAAFAKTAWNKHVGYRSRVKENRETLHVLLRYALTDDTEIPEFIHESLKKEGAECHEGPQKLMELDKMHGATSDIDVNGRVESYSPIMESEPLETALLPGTRFDPERGFVFHLGHRIMSPQTIAEKNISSWFWDNIHAVASPAMPMQQTLCLTPDQFEEFCKRAHQAVSSGQIAEMTGNIEFDDKKNDIISDIDADMANITESEAFKTVIRDSLNADKEEPQNRAKRLAYATSALTDMLGDDTFDKEWRFHRWTARNDSPVEEEVEKADLLLSVLEHYEAEGKIDNIHLEAIARHPNFHKFLGFARGFMSVMEGDMKSIPRKTPAQKIRQAQYEGLKEIFEQASLSRVSIHEQHLDEDAQDILEVAELSTEQGNTPMVRTAKKGAEGYYDFVRDLFWVAPREAPVATFALLAVVTAYYEMDWSILGGVATPEATATAQAVSESTKQAPAGMNDMFGGMGENTGELSGYEATGKELEDGVEGKDWHWHKTIWGQYKHYFAATIENTARTISMATEAAMGTAVEAFGGTPVENSDAYLAAKSAAKSSGEWSFITNLFQNGPAHYPMYTRFIAQNAKFGPNGFRHMLKFFHETVDAVRATAWQRPGALVGGAIGYTFDTYGPAQQILQNLVGSPEPLNTGLLCTLAGTLAGAKLYHRRRFAKGGMAEALNQTAQEKIKAALSVSAEDMMESVAQAAVTIDELRVKGRKASLKGEFALNADNYNETRRALQQMDMAMSLFADEIGAGGEFYQNFIKKKIDTVVKTMEGYKDGVCTHADLEEALQENLQDLVGAQLYLSGESPLYKALYGHDPAKKRQKHMLIEARYGHARENRSEANQNDKIENTKLSKKLQKINVETKMMKSAGADWKTFWSNAAVNRYGDLRTAGASSGNILRSIYSSKFGTRNAWDFINQSVKIVRQGFNRLDHKKKIAWGAGLASIGLMMMDKAGYSGAGSDVADILSQGVGYGGTAALATAVFLIINYLDDQIVVHGGLGSVASAVGASWYGGVKKVVMPSKRFFQQQFNKKEIEDLKKILEERLQAKGMSLSNYGAPQPENNL